MKFLFSSVLFLLALTVSGQGQWVTVVTQGSYYQGYKSFSELEDALAEVTQQTKKGNYVADMEFGNGEWKLVYEEDETSNQQSWANSVFFMEDWLEEQKEKNFNITRITYGQFKWVAFARKQTVVKKQLFNVVDSWEEVVSWLKKVWVTEPKYNIADIAYGDGEWGVLLNYSENEEHQIFTVSESYPSSWIQSKFNDNYNVSAIESDGAKWYVVMTRKKSQKSEKIISPTTNFPASDIKTEWDKSRRITVLAYHVDSETENYNEYMRWGAQSLEKGKYSDALDFYLSAALIDASSHILWNQIAWTKYLLEDCEDALTYADKSISIEANHNNLHTKAMVLHCRGNNAEALTFLNRAIDTHIRSKGEFKEAGFYLDRAEIKFKLKDKNGALADLKKAETIEPYNKVVTIRVEDLRSKLN